MKVTELYATLMKVHETLGVLPLNQLPANLWICALDMRWTIVLNGNREGVSIGPDNGTQEQEIRLVSPFACGVWFKNRYVGEFDADNGAMLGDFEVSEETLLVAMQTRIAHAKPKDS